MQLDDLDRIRGLLASGNVKRFFDKGDEVVMSDQGAEVFLARMGTDKMEVRLTVGGEPFGDGLQVVMLYVQNGEPYGLTDELLMGVAVFPFELPMRDRRLLIAPHRVHPYGMGFGASRVIDITGG